jgi:hypothetical protein
MANNTGKCIYKYDCECVSPGINNIMCRLGPLTKVINSAEGCTADGCRYTAYLLGKNEENSAFYYEISLAIESCSCCMAIRLSDFVGYEPKIRMLDFTGDGGDDMYITVASGGSGGYEFFNIFTFQNCTLTKLFSSQEFNQISQYTAMYMDGCKVAVMPNDGSALYLIDISCRDEAYLSQIYDEECMLLAPVSGMVGGANYSQSIINGNRTDLQVYQRITGLYNADQLGNVITSLSYIGGKFVPYMVMVATSSCPMNETTT